MAKILLGGVVAGVVVLFWGLVAATCCYPSAKWALHSIPNEEGLTAAMKKDVREPGLVLCAGLGQEQVAVAEKRWRLTWRKSPRGRTASW